MASLNQNFTKFAYDSFIIQFTVTSDVGNLSDYDAVWYAGLEEQTGANSISNPTNFISKSTSGFEDYGGINFDSGNSRYFVTLSKADFTFLEGNNDFNTNYTYAHELTLVSGSGAAHRVSTVVARGSFTINKALFPSSQREIS